MNVPSLTSPIREIPRRRSVPDSLAIFVVASVVFGFQLGSEPHFVDESAYIAQSFYADLMLDGRRNDESWLDYAAYDLPPLPKYLIGISLRLGGFARPGLSSWSAWFDNTKREFVADAAYLLARLPSVLMGAAGCVGFYWLAKRALGRPAGLVAAGLLLLSPLYYLHSRRAMSDVPAEAFMMLALAAGLTSWSRWIVGRETWRAVGGMSLLAGLFVGLAVVSKLNGAIAGFILAGWVGLAMVIPRVKLASKVGISIATLGAGFVAFATFVALNPFLTAHPVGTIRPAVRGVAALSFLERLDVIKTHRVYVSKIGQHKFPKDALLTLPDKLTAVVVQGYGRFSPLGPRHSDSTRRFDWRQDWSAVLWIPLVVVGLVVCLFRGRDQLRRAEPPTAWAVVVAAMVAFVVVTSFIPLAWDRYYISLQPGAILLGSAAITAPFARWFRPELT